jgi:hypothetical protein
MMRDENVFMDESNITADMVSHAAAAAEAAAELEGTANEENDDDETNTKDRQYSFKELQYLCLNVYQQELLKVCDLDKTDEISMIGYRLDAVWDKIFTEPGCSERFKLMILRHQDMYFKDMKNAPGIHKMYFAIMFDFDVFHILHRCLGDMFSQDGNISKELLDELEEELMRQKKRAT